MVSLVVYLKRGMSALSEHALKIIGVKHIFSLSVVTSNYK